MRQHSICVVSTRLIRILGQRPWPRSRARPVALLAPSESSVVCWASVSHDKLACSGTAVRTVTADRYSLESEAASCLCAALPSPAPGASLRARHCQPTCRLLRAAAIAATLPASEFCACAAQPRAPARAHRARGTAASIACFTCSAPCAPARRACPPARARPLPAARARALLPAARC